MKKDFTKYTRAKSLREIGREPWSSVRFPTVAGERGEVDAERDIRGFAMEIYTGTGNRDLPGNNTPVSFLRAPYRVPEFIRILHSGNCLNADPAYGKGVADALGIPPDTVK